MNPSEAITRWQGTLGAYGLHRNAPPTALGEGIKGLGESTVGSELAGRYAEEVSVDAGLEWRWCFAGRVDGSFGGGLHGGGFCQFLLPWPSRKA